MVLRFLAAFGSAGSDSRKNLETLLASLSWELTLGQKSQRCAAVLPKGKTSYKGIIHWSPLALVFRERDLTAVYAEDQWSSSCGRNRRKNSHAGLPSAQKNPLEILQAQREREANASYGQTPSSTYLEGILSSGRRPASIAIRKGLLLAKYGKEAVTKIEEEAKKFGLGVILI